MIKKQKNKALNKYLLTVGMVWGIGFGLMLAVYLFILSPQADQMVKIQRQFQDTNEQKMLAATASQPQARQKLDDKLQQVIDKAGQFVIASEQTSALMFQISQIAAQCQLKEFATKNKEVKSPAEGAKPRIVEGWVELTFISTFSQFAEFISGLERNRPYLFVEDVAIERSADGKQEHQVKVLVSCLIANPSEVVADAK